MNKPTWRLIRSPISNGAWNMALDESLLMSVGQGNALPTLRLYAWAPPCITLGYSQPFSDVDMERLEKRKWHIVRRPSGGRAILHTDELTYSVITPADEGVMKGGIIDSYRKLSSAILSAINQLGVGAIAEEEYDLPEGTDKKGAVCFEVPSNYEITYNNKKLVGSAQVRRKDGVLQHGTIPLNGDITRIIQVLQFDNEEKREFARGKVLDRAINLETILNREVRWEELADHLQEAFAEALGVNFAIQEPTSDEVRNASRLVDEKYLNEEWTKRVHSASRG